MNNQQKYENRTDTAAEKQWEADCKVERIADGYDRSDVAGIVAEFLAFNGDKKTELGVLWKAIHEQAIETLFGYPSSGNPYALMLARAATEWKAEKSLAEI